MTPPLREPDAEPDPAVWRAMKDLVEANDSLRDAYQRWVEAARKRDSPESTALRAAEARVVAARARLAQEATRARGDGDEWTKSWGAH